MANKSNTALDVSREAVAAFATCMKSTAVHAEHTRGSLGSTFAYLTDPDNMSGTDVQSFIEAVEHCQELVNTVASRMGTAARGADKTSEILNDEHGKVAKPMAEATEALKAKMAAMKAAAQ